MNARQGMNANNAGVVLTAILAHWEQGPRNAKRLELFRAAINATIDLFLVEIGEGSTPPPEQAPTFEEWFALNARCVEAVRRTAPSLGDGEAVVKAMLNELAMAGALRLATR